MGHVMRDGMMSDVVGRCFGTLVSSDPSPVSLGRAAEGVGPPAAKLRTRSMLALLRAAVRRINQDCAAYSAYELSGEAVPRSKPCAPELHATLSPL